MAVALLRVPNSDHDRIRKAGEPMSFKNFADLINAQRYQAMFCDEDASPVALAMLNNDAHVGAASYVANPGRAALARPA